ncbi:MAG: PDDEXK nuclease domain-containing protein [Clostridium sp.]|nr:PDDEXK nuclease domain-containing protein [Clostridium sp.]
MQKKPYITHSHDVRIDNEYNQWLAELIKRYRHSQIKAAVKVNSEKLLWNWHTGRDLVRRKAEENWGSGIVEQLSLDLQAAFPGETGFSARNLWYMKKWYLFYSTRFQQPIHESTLQSDSFTHRLGVKGQITDNNGVQILHQVGAEFENEQMPSLFSLVPWKHHVEIISKCESIDEALFYLKYTVQESLSKQGLLNCIKANLFAEKGKALTNYQDKLSLPQAKLAQEITRGNYDFSFVHVPKEYCERDLEDALCNQMTRFLLELGNGFAFIGRQKELVVSGVSRRIDLLFYHIRLRSYIVLEIKAKPFDPCFAGQINFYVNAVDDALKSPDDNPTIGLLICSDMRDTDVQLSFKGITTPLGVATYNNVQLEEIKRQLPTYDQLVERVRQLEGLLNDA